MEPPTPPPPPKASTKSDQSFFSSEHHLLRTTSDSALLNLASTGEDESRRRKHKTRLNQLFQTHSRSTLISRTNSFSEQSDTSMGDFSIDLAKLGEKSSSSFSLGAAGKRTIEGVPSEDDGPEDFTLRMGEWMRGALPWSRPKEYGQDDVNAKDHGEKIVEPDQEDVLANMEDHAKQGADDDIMRSKQDESEFLPLGTSTPVHLMKKINASNISWISRNDTEQRSNRAPGEDSGRISELQHELESLRVENEKHESMQRSLEDARIQHEHEFHALQNQLYDVKSEVQRLRDSEFKASQKKLRLEQELQRECSKGSSLQSKLAAATQGLETTRLKSEADRQALESKIDSLQRELRVAQKDKSKQPSAEDSAQNPHVAELNALRSALAACKADMESQNELFHARHQADVSSRENIRSEMDSAVNVAKAAASMCEIELDHAKEQLTETRRVLATVEQENDRLVRENGRQNDRIVEVKNLIDVRTAELKAAQSNGRELENELSRVQSSFVGSSSNDISESPNTEALRAQYEKEIKTLRSTILKAGQGMQKREKRLFSAHQEEIARLNKQINSLRQQVSSPSPQATDPADPDGTVAELRTAIRVLNNKLQKANATARSAYQEAAKARQELQEGKNMNEEVNRELEAMFAKAMEDREREWRRRIKVVFKDRERIGKALLMAWGREECGKAMKGERQVYKYKCVNRDGSLEAGVE
ncbi:MAG: hypothetical protein LQ342_002656 [Letrouitia transgressa]|nr:MAG: hypothetical protein LQ342_002656 [Letrouitia transgressa]